MLSRGAFLPRIQSKWQTGQVCLVFGRSISSAIKTARRKWVHEIGGWIQGLNTPSMCRESRASRVVGIERKMGPRWTEAHEVDEDVHEALH